MLPLFAIVLPIIILGCGLSIDVAMLELKRVQMQTAADAAARGAELEWERCSGNQVIQGQADAAVNGFTNGVNNVSVSVVTPGAGGDYNNRYDVLYVTITQTVRTIFMGALNAGTATVSVSAAAQMPPCGYLLETAGISNTYSLNLINSASLPNQGMFSRCPVYIANNLYLDSGMGLDEYAINATGTAAQSSLNGSYYPTPTYDARTLTDPLAAISQPALSACNHTSFSATSATTLDPGTYCGSGSTPGMTLSSANIYFNPGLYVITGGMRVHAASLSGSGVTLFFTRGNCNSYGQVIFDGDSHIDLSAPTASSAGALATILFFTDRNWVHTSPQDVQLNDAEYSGDGIWYINGTGVQLTDGSATWSSHYLALIADSVVVNSSTLNLFSDFSAINTGNPFRTSSVIVQ